MQKDYQYALIEARSHTAITRKAKEVVLNNIYRQYYDIPNDLKVRKPDAVLKTIVDTSETLKKVESLIEHGMHPSLIFFSKELFENQINKVMRNLHGTSIANRERLSMHFQ